MGLGFGALYLGTIGAGDDGKSPLIWLVLAYMLHTTGELCLSPIGLSMITKLSPKRIVALMMGTWFLATAYAQYLAALIAKLTSIDHSASQGTEGTLPNPTETIMVYGDVWAQIAIVTMGVGAFFIIITPLIRKLMKEVH